ncbi:FHF complex subunit HOOK-interacting protein 1A-like [Osmerus eperlanus]|uniref:FHF complex subunit HOOK-interacting protein 1A-like n=1 Tax=Osmerus eperlanus TaxID=29151 RepID=UPI002E0FA9EF
MMASVVTNGNRKKSLSLKGVDPETCMIVFKNHWAQVVKILEKHEPGRGGLSFLSSGGRLGPVPGDEASAVQNYVEHMLFLLMEEEAGQGGAMGPILEFVVVEGVMERLFLWSLRRQFTDDMKVEQLRMYQMLLGQARQPLLHHKPLLRPLMMLLASCTGGGAGAGAGGGAGGGARVVEEELVLLLNQLCVALARDPSVLELFFHAGEDQGAANFLLFSLLIPYTHREGPVGRRARDALLSIMMLSHSDPRVATHITDNTYFCPVLATGLSGLYSSLPARLQVFSEDWFCLEPSDWSQVPALVQILNSLHFCCSVIRVAHPSIRAQLLGYIYNGFLVPVLAPALHKLTLEEVMTTTAYLELFLRSVSEPALLRCFLSFILTHTHDGLHILDTLVSRVNTPFQLGTVSLALFRTLIGLFCEDVMLQLILRYLLPCARPGVQERDCYSCSASRLLLLSPPWSLSPSHSQRLLWPGGTGSPLSGEDSVGCQRDPAQPLPLELIYLHYLRDARVSIQTALRACSVWSAPYDGLSPAPAGPLEGEEGGETGEEVRRGRTDTSTPPPPLATTPDPVTGGNVELEWDDMFDVAPDEGAGPGGAQGAGAQGGPEPPQHLQALRRTATLLVRGSYIEEDGFQDDVLVYDLIAQKDASAHAQRCSGVGARQGGGGGREECVSTLTNRQNCGERRVSREEEERRRLDRNMNVNRVVTLENDQLTSDLCNGHADPAPTPAPTLTPDPAPTATGDDFLSQYRALMLSLGAEPDEDDISGDISSFRRRVERLRKRREEEEEEEEELCRFLSEEPQPDLEQENVLEAGSRKQGVPFTGPFISVLLSRLENLLENSIPVNLLVTGILSQLACHPQPLLHAFLLNTHTHPGARTLYQVLVSVGAQIEQYVSARPELPALVRQAWSFLLVREELLKTRECVAEGDAGVLLNGHSVPGSSGACRPPSSVPPCPPIPAPARSRVFALVLYAEFLKELAAIAQEHAILPCLEE